MVALYFHIKWFLLQEQFQVIRKYYRSPRFAFADFLVGVVSFFFNPYRVCRKFLQKRGESLIHTYGETPLSSFAQIAKAANISKNDSYVELGSGRGKTALWAASWIGCRTMGIEWIPLFANFASLIARIVRAPASFECKSFFESDLSSATVVYMYAIHLTEYEMDALDPALDSMAPGSRLVTIGSCVANPNFTVAQSIPVRFPWGETIAIIQTRI